MSLSQSISALLDIPGHSVTAIHPRPDEDPPEVIIELGRTLGVYRCPCGYETTRYWDSEEFQVRDLPMSRWKVVWLCFRKFRVRCPTCQTIRTEELSWIDLQQRATKRFQDEVALACRGVTERGGRGADAPPGLGPCEGVG